MYIPQIVKEALKFNPTQKNFSYFLEPTVLCSSDVQCQCNLVVVEEEAEAVTEMEETEWAVLS